MSNLSWQSDEQMARLQPFFPKSHGKPRVDGKPVLSGILFINRNGLPWPDVPREYGLPKTLCNRWKRWSDMGVFARIMERFAAEAADHKAITIPLVTLLRNALPGSDQDHVRTPERLASCRHPL